MIHHRHLRTTTRRALLSMGLVVIVTAVGTVGMHVLEKMPWLDAFYFISMIATAQGAAFVPQSAPGKIFAALMSYLSVGTVVVALGFLFGPLFGKLWHIGQLKYEEEAGPGGRK